MDIQTIRKKIGQLLLVLFILLLSSGMTLSIHTQVDGENRSIQEINQSRSIEIKTIPPGVPVPPAPSNVQSSDGNYWDRIHTTWDASADATYYQIYRSTGNAAGPYDEYLGTTTDLLWDYMTTSHTVEWFGIWACNSFECSSWYGHDPTGGYADANFDTPGIYVPGQKMWYLKETPEDGWVNYLSIKFAGASNWVPVTGDWNNNGQETVGFYNPDQKSWYLKNSHTDGWLDYITVKFGGSGTTWIPVTGDWDNDGFDSIGFYVTDQKRWYLKNSFTNGWVDYITVNFGGSGSNWIPVVGDWNLTGMDTAGLYNSAQKTWYLKNTHANGWVDYDTVVFGALGSDWMPVGGGWGNS